MFGTSVGMTGGISVRIGGITVAGGITVGFDDVGLTCGISGRNVGVAIGVGVGSSN